MSGGESSSRRTAIFGGRVQGVGFRYTTQRIARRFPLAGYVQNLADGRVLLVAEGDAAALERFFRAVREQLSEYIESAEIADGPASGEFQGFDIRF